MGFTGGGVEAEETLLDALKREIREETGLELINEPTKICTFTEYFYDIDTKQGWESTRHFYVITPSGILRVRGNDDDITAVCYFQQPLPPSKVAPVAREIIAMAGFDE